MELSKADLDDLGLKVIEKDRGFGGKAWNLVRIQLESDGIYDTEPDVVFFKKGSREFVLVGCALEGHGTFRIYEVKL